MHTCFGVLDIQKGGENGKWAFVCNGSVRDADNTILIRFLNNSQIVTAFERERFNDLC